MYFVFYNYVSLVGDIYSELQWLFFVCVGFDQYAPMRHSFCFLKEEKNNLLSKHSDKHYNDWQEVIYVKKEIKCKERFLFN